MENSQTWPAVVILNQCGRNSRSQSIPWSVKEGNFNDFSIRVCTCSPHTELHQHIKDYTYKYLFHASAIYHGKCSAS